MDDFFANMELQDDDAADYERLYLSMIDSHYFGNTAMLKNYRAPTDLHRLIKQNRFSTIELMAVITVILILMTLLVPSLKRIRAKARTVICANQMKQVGLLISTYANDHDGRLPYSGGFNEKKDFDIKGNKLRGGMYPGWSGHLLPYFNLNLKSYSRGPVYYEKSIDDITTPNHSNHQIIKDQMYNGGHGDLKILICPDATTTIDVASLKSGRTHPRISSSLKSTPYWQSSGLPTSYLGHSRMFGKAPIYRPTFNSLRIEDVHTKDIMLAEGCNYSFSYDSFGDNITFYSNVSTFSMCDWNNNNEIVKSNVLFSYLHDNTKEIWISNKPNSKYFITSFVNRFNKAYSPYAAASKQYGLSYTKKGILASTRYPGEKWELFKGILADRKFTIEKFYAEDSGRNYFFGSMNCLSADFSVSSKNIGWLYENAREITLSENLLFNK
ncbi:MAG: hypothetical protein COA79_18160 [Planctomycetota bacterium]|nr:MAG: hypothetical protein COA79_18160 [Planctomycetota bacterium]